MDRAASSWNENSTLGGDEFRSVRIASNAPGSTPSVKIDQSSSIDLGNSSTSDGFSYLTLSGALTSSNSVQIAWKASGSDLSDLRIYSDLKLGSNVSPG